MVRIIASTILLLVAGCTAPAAGRMPAGHGPVTIEPGFAAYCAGHVGAALCP